MSKFFEALQQAEWDQARQTQASLAPARVGLLEALPPAAPLEEAPPRVLGTAQTVTEVAVDRSDRVDEHLVSLVSPGAFEATEQYRVLRHIVETLRKSANLQVVAITSPGVGEGKTSTAINLAGALAQSAAARVLLMDIDLRRPAVARQLGLAGSKRSFVDALVDARLTLEDTVEYLSAFNLSVLAGDRPAVAPYELLKSSRLEALLDEARRRYDYIVVDAPPFVPVPDCRLIAKCVDGFLIVVAADRTPRGVLAEVLDQMEPAKVMGLVFNGEEARRSSYYGAYSGSPRGAGRRRPWREAVTRRLPRLL